MNSKTEINIDFSIHVSIRALSGVINNNRPSLGIQNKQVNKLVCLTYLCIRIVEVFMGFNTSKPRSLCLYLYLKKVIYSAIYINKLRIRIEWDRTVPKKLIPSLSISYLLSSSLNLWGRLNFENFERSAIRHNRSFFKRQKERQRKLVTSNHAIYACSYSFVSRQPHHIKISEWYSTAKGSNYMYIYHLGYALEKCH